MASDPTPWTTRRLLTWTTQYFERKGLDSPRVSAEMLLAHVLSTTRLRLYMDADRPASELERSAFRDLVERAIADEPVDYLVGHAPFFSMMFKVTPDVLIPRPSTETIVEHVIQHVRRTPGFAQPTILDLGTGSGAIAIALAKHVAGSHVVATDLSEAALAVARVNAETHGVTDRIDFRQGDLFAPVTGQRFRYIVSNPPYISDAEWVDVEPNVRDHEPVLALRAGAEGLDVIAPLIDQACDYLETPGQLLVEFAAAHREAAPRLASATGRLMNARVLHDHERLPRVLVADFD